MKYFGTITAMLCAAFFMTGCGDSSETKDTSCQNNLKQIGLALKHYAMDNNDLLPVTHNEVGLRLLGKGDNAIEEEVYCCPMKKDVKVGYYYIGGFRDFDVPPNTPIAFDKPGNHDGHVNVLFHDGHVESVKISDYKKPEDVIKVVGEKYKLSPESIAVLLACCKEMQ